MDLRWDNDRDAGLRAIPKLKKACPSTRVVAISAYDELLPKARLWGADATLSKNFSRDQLIATIRAVSVEPVVIPPIIEIQTNADRYFERLAALKPGKQDAKAYEHLMEELLPFLLSDHLSEFESQCRHREGHEIWDLVAYIHSADSLWLDLRINHRSDQIIFEMKNTRPPKGSHVQQLVGYLGERSMHVGVIVTRKRPTHDAIVEARSTFDKRGDVILFLTDDDLQEMIRMKKQGDDPTQRLLRVYLELTRHQDSHTRH